MSLNQQLYYACKNGDISLVLSLIEEGANSWNWGLRGALSEGIHLNIINLMIERGADDWNGGLYCACQAGNIDIVNLMIEKGANYWNAGLEGACKGGHIDIVITFSYIC